MDGSQPESVTEDTGGLDSPAPAEVQAPEAARRSDGNSVNDDDTGERKWKLLFAFLVLATVGVVVVSIVVAATRDDGAANEQDTGPKAVTINSAQGQLDFLREALAENEATTSYRDILPSDAGSLKDKSSNENEAVIRAASWLVHEDPFNEQEQLVPRFALAVLYFGTAGESWKFSTNWLSANSICGAEGWYGVVCGDPGHGENHEFAEKVRELDLFDNNLAGELPVSVALLVDLRVLWLNDNKLTSLPGDALGSIPSLVMLYLQYNEFTGPIPDTLLANGILGTFKLIDIDIMAW